MTYLLFAPVVLWGLWGLYVLIMGLYRARLANRLTRASLVLGAPYIALGYLVDFAVNVTIASLVFVELPRELLVTNRLMRHQLSGTGWRRNLSMWICDNLLDEFDPSGNHC